MPTPDWMNVPDPGPEPPRPDEFEVGVDPTGMVRRRIQRDHDEWLRHQRLFLLANVARRIHDEVQPLKVVADLRMAVLLLIELEIERKASPVSSFFGF